MHTLVVYCHPWEGSLNHATLEALRRRLAREGHDCEVIDLYADGFEAALSREELAHYGEGRALDPLVMRYQRLVGEAEHLAIICPIWWNDVPAMLRGFFDKVMLSGFSWESTPGGLLGTLTGIADADVYTTSAGSTEHIELAVRSSFIEGTLAQLGIGGLPAPGADRDPRPCPTRRWHNFEFADGADPERVKAWLAEVEGL